MSGFPFVMKRLLLLGYTVPSIKPFKKNYSHFCFIIDYIRFVSLASMYRPEIPNNLTMCERVFFLVHLCIYFPSDVFVLFASCSSEPHLSLPFTITFPHSMSRIRVQKHTHWHANPTNEHNCWGVFFSPLCSLACSSSFASSSSYSVGIQ